MNWPLGGARPIAHPDARDRGTNHLAFAGAGAAAVALVVVALLFRNDGSAPPPSPTPGVELAGISQGDRVLGNPAAKVTLIEYADAQCPGCRFYTEEIFPTVADDYVRSGKVKNEFRGFPFIGPDSVKRSGSSTQPGCRTSCGSFREPSTAIRAARTTAV